MNLLAQMMHEKAKNLPQGREIRDTKLAFKLAGRLTDESPFLPLILTAFKIRAKLTPF